MRSSGRVTSVVASAIIVTRSCLCSALAADPPLDSSGKSNAAPLIEQMVGTWKVRERMWFGQGRQAIDLPSATAHRRLVAGGFLEEHMNSTQEPDQEPFTRISYFNYRAVNQQFEYFSIDSRAPQMMNEKSVESALPPASGREAGIDLYGGIFVVPRWGDSVDAAFRYRLKVGQVKDESQVVQLCLTPMAGDSTREFLAFEYVYTLVH